MEQTIEQLLGAVDPDSIDDITVSRGSVGLEGALLCLQRRRSICMFILQSVFYEIGDLMEENSWDFCDTMLTLISMLTHGERPASVMETAAILLEHFSEDMLDDGELVVQVCAAAKQCLASPMPGLRSSVGALLASMAPNAWPIDTSPDSLVVDWPDSDGILVQPLLQAAA